MAAGLGALLPATASSGEEKPTARVGEGERRSRNDFSFGYAMTRRSGPVSVRIPAITAYCTPEESTNSFTTAFSVTLPLFHIPCAAASGVPNVSIDANQ